MIPIFEPYLRGNERRYLNQCLDDNWISSAGPFVTRLEDAISAYYGAQFTVSTSSCTTALHLTLSAIGIGPGDEVICPALTFISPINMVILCGAKPILVDIEPSTLTIDPLKIENKITERTKAILVVHQFGHAANLDPILDIVDKYDLKLIEDNAEAMGARYRGKLLGTFGHASTNSFYGNKIITSGEGGVIVTNCQKIADHCKLMRDHGMQKDGKYQHSTLGFNYRLTNIQAAIGFAQLEQLDKILLKRNEQKIQYDNLIQEIDRVQIRKTASWCEPVHWLTTIQLDEDLDRDAFIMYMHDNGYECRQMVNPVHWALHLADLYDQNAFPIANFVSKQSVHLPSSTSLKPSQISSICNAISSFVR